MRLPRAVRDRICERVIVTLKSGEAFEGVLFEADAGALVLRDSSAVAAADDLSNLPLDGELLVLMADVAFIQRP